MGEGYGGTVPQQQILVNHISLGKIQLIYNHRGIFFSLLTIVLSKVEPITVHRIKHIPLPNGVRGQFYFLKDSDKKKLLFFATHVHKNDFFFVNCHKLLEYTIMTPKSPNQLDITIIRQIIANSFKVDLMSFLQKCRFLEFGPPAGV